MAASSRTGTSKRRRSSVADTIGTVRGASTAGTAAAAISTSQLSAYQLLVTRSASAPTSMSITIRTASPSIRGRGRRIGLSDSSAAVNRGDLVGVLLQHHIALDLQGGRQLTCRLGEVARQDAERLDRLGVRDGPVSVVDAFLDGRT